MTSSSQAAWEPRYAERAQRMVASEIRELLKVLDAPNVISFAGGIPDPALFPVPEIEAAYREVLSDKALAGLGLAWSTATLTTDGTIRVVSGAPQVTGVGRSGSQLVVSGISGYPDQQYRVLASTNVILPLTNWTPILTNVFGSDGSFSFTNNINLPQRFFRLAVP